MNSLCFVNESNAFLIWNNQWKHDRGNEGEQFNFRRYSWHESGKSPCVYCKLRCVSIRIYFKFVVDVVMLHYSGEQFTKHNLMCTHWLDTGRNYTLCNRRWFFLRLSKTLLFFASFAAFICHYLTFEVVVPLFNNSYSYKILSYTHLNELKIREKHRQQSGARSNWVCVLYNCEKESLGQHFLKDSSSRVYFT